jgi:lipoprotein-releasing system permease protein
MPGVAAVAPFVHAQALAMGAGHNYYEGVLVMGLPPDGPNTPQVTGIRSKATAGDFTFKASNGEPNGAVIGRKLAERFNLTPGVDTIRLMTMASKKIDPITGQIKPNVIELEVTGIFDTGMYEYDNSYVVIALSSAQRLLELGDAVTGLEIRTPDLWEAPAIAQALQDSLGMPFLTQDWRAQNNSLFNALKLEKLGMTVILLLIVLVAAFNIISTLIMVVSDKTKEIGILRAMGMPAASIRRIFFAQGVVIGVVGTLIGLVVGLAASEALGRGKLIALDPSVYFIDHLPVATEPFDVALIVLASLGVAALATIYPSRQAARLYPVEAIRHE